MKLDIDDDDRGSTYLPDLDDFTLSNASEELPVPAHQCYAHEPQPLVSYATSDSEEESVVHQPTKWKKFTEAKETVVSTTAGALKAIAEGGEKKGLLKFFHKETVEERGQRMRRERVESDLWQQKAAEETVFRAGREAAAKEKERFDAKMRKRKSRSKTYHCEREAGLCDENLRLKRRRVSSASLTMYCNCLISILYSQVIHANLHYSDSDTNIAVKSRPAHEIREWYKAKEQKRKPKGGRHQTRMKRPACYVNWITPFCWTQIRLVGRKTTNGEGLSPSGIVQWLHCFDNPTFRRLSKSTVAEWIEKKNGVRVWKESILTRAKHGNLPGHDKGGCRGILVR